MIIIVILSGLALLGLGGWAGWRAGVYLTDKKMLEENTFLRQHVDELKRTINYWSEQSSYNRNVHNETINNHNNQLHNTLTAILNLLEKQNKDTLKEDEKEQVENIIKTIKSL